MYTLRLRPLLAPVLCLMLSAADAAETYTLAPGDHVQVKVSDFRAGTGEAYQWTGFSTEPYDFIVSPSGVLSLPVVGDLDAEGKTTSEVEQMISAKLQTKAGLTSKPDTSVQIVKFRPFYVVGSVDKPGEYDYRPGLTVLQAVSIAGGNQRVTTDAMLGLLRDALNSRGDLRVLAADRVSFRARQARLDAEINDKTEVVFPNELTSTSSDPDVARNMREEQLLFESRRSGLASEVAILERNKSNLREEIESLHQKTTTIAQQLAASRRELAVIAGLVSKGLSGTPRQLELEQNVAQIESNQLDVLIAIQRATEDIARADKDIVDLQQTRRNDILAEASDVRIKLAETIEKMDTARTIVESDEVRAPALLMSNISGYDNPNYQISRRGKDGRADEQPAVDSDLVMPGDVVRVIPKVSGKPTSSDLSPAAERAN